jgi:hypothetical protein
MLTVSLNELYAKRYELRPPTEVWYSRAGLYMHTQHSRTTQIQRSMQAVAQLVEYCATSRKVVGTSPDNDTVFLIYIILPAALWVDNASNRNDEYEKSFCELRQAGNLTAICEPTVKKMWEPRRLTTLWAWILQLYLTIYKGKRTMLLACHVNRCFSRKPTIIVIRVI